MSVPTLPSTSAGAGGGEVEEVVLDLEVLAEQDTGRDRLCERIRVCRGCGSGTVAFVVAASSDRPL